MLPQECFSPVAAIHCRATLSASPCVATLDPFPLPVNQRLVTRPVGGIYYVEPQAREPYQQQWSLSSAASFPHTLGCLLIIWATRRCISIASTRPIPASLRPTQL